jgi:hypothetical protein
MNINVLSTNLKGIMIPYFVVVYFEAEIEPLINAKHTLY